MRQFQLDSYAVKQYEGERVVDTVTLVHERWPTRKKYVLVHSPKLHANVLAPTADLRARSHGGGYHGGYEGMDLPGPEDEPMVYDGFDLHIDLGNEAMQTGDDVAGALEKVIRRLRDGAEGGTILDLNGNDVGTWDLR